MYHIFKRSPLGRVWLFSIREPTRALSAVIQRRRGNIALITGNLRLLSSYRSTTKTTFDTHFPAYVSGESGIPSIAGVFYPENVLPDRRIAVMPRSRGAELCSHVLSLLTVRGALDGWDVVNIAGLSQTETAEILRSSAIFLSFSEREGFGLPPAEAMACGCYVVGFTGLGGREFFYPGLCTPVEEGNVLALANSAEEAMSNFDRDASNMRELALRHPALSGVNTHSRNKLVILVISSNP